MNFEDEYRMYQQMSEKEKIWYNKIKVFSSTIETVLLLVLFYLFGIFSAFYYVDRKIAEDGIFEAKTWNCMQEVEEDVE